MKRGARKTAQLIPRGLDPELEACIRCLAKNEGLSLDEAVMRLARRGAGLDPRADEDVVGDSLDRFIGTWSDRDVREMVKAVEMLDGLNAAAR